MIILFIIVFSCLYQFDVIILIHYLFTVLALLVSFNFLFRNKQTGYIVSLIASFSMILMLFENDYINFIIGIYVFTYSLIYLIKK